MSAVLDAPEADAPLRRRATTYDVIQFVGEAARLLAVPPGGEDGERRPVSAVTSLTNARAIAAAAGMMVEAADHRLAHALASAALLPAGLRWAPSGTPAWIGALDAATALAEVAHHMRREAHRAGLDELRGRWRVQSASITGRFLDARGDGERPALGADPVSWALSQRLGARMAARGDVDGVLHDSARRRGGAALVVFKSGAGALVLGRMGAIFDLRVPAEGAATARRVSNRERAP
jgi:hypothetical protein